VELRASRWVGYLLYLLVAREDGMGDYNCIDVIRGAPSDSCRRSTILNFIHPAARPRESASVHFEPPEPPDLQSRRRRRSSGKRRFPRQKARDQEIMGLSQRKNVAKLFRTRRAQDKATPIAEFAEAHVRIGTR
jgi:hypothetical protein